MRGRDNHRAHAAVTPQERSDMQEEKGTGRRNLFRAAAGTATAAGIATLIPAEAEAYDPGQEERRARYRETDHVRAFYRVNGYQTLGNQKKQ